MIAFPKNKPFNHLHDAEDDEDSIPGPKDQIDLVDDDIEGKDAEGIQLALAPCRPVLIVVAAGHLGPKQSDIQYVLSRVMAVRTRGKASHIGLYRPASLFSSGGELRDEGVSVLAAPVVPIHVRPVCQERVAQESVRQEKLGTNMG